jgi:hypothetical protein
MAAARQPARPEVLDANQFVLEHGRLPILGKDKIPPWQYSGFLIYYIQLGDRAKAPEVIDRWNYHLRTLEAGHLLAEPIPQILFGHEGHAVDEGSAGHAEVEKWIDIVYHEIGSVSAFSAVLDFLQWGLGLSRQYPRLTEKTMEALYRGVNLEPLLKHPYDYLGDIYQGTKTKRWNSSAYYNTPHVVCEMMTRMVMLGPEERAAALASGKDPRLATVMEPCVGSGRFLLHASNYSLCLYGQDIDAVCCAMSRINGVFYAPWIAFPFPARILQAPVPAPPPALLPIPDAPAAAIRVDDRGQGLLFDPKTGL